MKPAEIYTGSQIDKLGNTIIFLCNRMQPITKTHLLKLIYIIEEASVKKFGMPFFGLRFEVWKLGPVSKDLFVELSSDEPTMLSSYITKDTINGQAVIQPKKQFCDDEFSDREMELLEEVADRFLHCTAKELINFTHRKNTPWYNAALQNGVLDILEEGRINSTEIPIDLSEMIKDDEQKLALYLSNQEYIDYSRNLK